MKLHLNQDADLYLVRGCAADRIMIGDRVYRSSLILTPNRVVDTWEAASAGALTQEDFVLMADLEPEVLLLGTGRRQQFPPRAITRPVIDLSVGLEVMTTAAACRTYNILAHEGRAVVAALIVEAAEPAHPG